MSTPIQPIIPASLSNDSFSTLEPTKPYQPHFNWDDDERAPYRSFNSRYATSAPTEYMSITKCLKEFYNEEKEKMYIKTRDLRKQDEMERNIQTFYGEVLGSYSTEDYQELQVVYDSSEEIPSSPPGAEVVTNSSQTAIEPEQDPLFMQTCNRFAYT